MSQTFTISELAREFDITTRTIRFYEDKQLLDPQRVGTARIYSRADRTRLRLVLRGKRLGLQLSEIRELIELYDSRNGAGEKKQLEIFVKRLQQTRATLLSQQEDIIESLADIDVLEANCNQQIAELNASFADKAVRLKKDIPATNKETADAASGRLRPRS